MKTNLLILILLLCLGTSCKKTFEVNKSDASGTSQNAPPAVNKGLILSSFAIENIDSNSFGVSFSYEGDENNNSDVKIYYCSIKQQPGCDPLSGSSIQLSPSANKLTASIDLSSPPFTPGDLIKYKIVASDTDGLAEGGSEEGHIIIPYDGTPKMLKQFSHITTGKASDAGGDESVADVAIDNSGNIYIAGSTNGSLGEANAGSNDVYVSKLTSSGSLDESFGGGDGIFQLGNVTLGSAASGDDSVSAISVDSSGNIFVAGNTAGSLGEANAGSKDAFILKLNSTGALDTNFGGGDGIVQMGNTTLGAAASGDDVVSALSVDSNGNIFVAGNTTGALGETGAGGADAFVLKLTPTGVLDTSFGGGDGIAQVGNVTLGAAASGNDYVSGMDLDSSGSIFVAGETSGPLGESNAGGADAFVLKLTSAGVLDTSFGGSDGVAQIGNDTIGAAASSAEDVHAISLDSSGNVFIVGDTEGPLGEANAGNKDAFIIKLNSTGSLDTSFGGNGIVQMGSATLGAAASDNDYAYAIKIDDSGGVFVAGDTAGSWGEANGGNRDAFIIKLDATGSLDNNFDGDGIAQMGNVTAATKAADNEYVSSLHFDGNANIYVTGKTHSSLGEGSAGGSDAFILKLTSAGALDTSFGNGDGVAQLGSVTAGVGASGLDAVAAISLDSSGNIFLAGDTTGSLGEANAGSKDVFVIKLNSSGALDTSFGGGDGIAQMGKVTVGAAASSEEMVFAMALDSAGNILVAGRTKGALGEVNAGERDAFVLKLDSTGALDTSFGGGDGIAQLGNATVGAAASGNEYVSAMSLDSSDNIFVTGWTTGALGESNGGSNDAFVFKLNSTGALDSSFGGDGIVQLGSVTVGAGSSSADPANAIILDSSGNVFVAGSTSGALGETNAGASDAYVFKLDSSGALDTSFGGGSGIVQLGNTTIGNAAKGTDVIHAMKLDSSGNIFLAGYSGPYFFSGGGYLGESNAGSYDAIVIKLDSSGSLDTSFGGGDGIAQMGDVTIGAAASVSDVVYAMSLDASGNILISGYTTSSLGESNAGGKDAFVLRLDSSGIPDTSFGGGDGIVQMGSVTAGSGASADDLIKAMALDASGNIFAVGETKGQLAEFGAGGSDIFLLQLDSTGNAP